VTVDLHGKVAIITGAATGIGRAVALELAALGCNIVVNYARSETDARATAADVEARGAAAIVACGDVANDEECRRVVDAAVAMWNRVDILVNNAGTTVFVPHAELEALSVEAWDRVFAVNVRGAFQMARAAATALRASGRGAIVNVSSTAATTGTGSSIAYAASKAALDNLTISLARVLAPAVRVNGVAPGFVDSRWLVDGYGEKLDAMKKLVKQQTPLRDVGSPQHIAQVVTSLVTGMDWVTGQTVTVDGGFVIRG
jgi:3-oxoacyl-[acyl-carrier protein] reductase